MTTRRRTNAAQIRAITAGLVRYENRYIDAMKELHRSYIDVQVEFEAAGLSETAGHEWINHILRYIVGHPDVYPDTPDIPQPQPLPFQLCCDAPIFQVTHFDRKPRGIPAQQLLDGSWCGPVPLCPMGHDLPDDDCHRAEYSGLLSCHEELRIFLCAVCLGRLRLGDELTCRVCKGSRRLADSRRIEMRDFGAAA